jgi:probable rRNA maturation factor
MPFRDLDILMDGIEVPWADAYEAFLVKALGALGAEDWEVSVTLTGDGPIQALNRQWRHKDEPTDVLSFETDPEDDPGAPVRPPRERGCYGDLVISMDTLRGNSAYFGVDLEEELQRVSIHGLMHLQGWDHASNAPDEPMLVRQEAVLAATKERIFR